MMAAPGVHEAVLREIDARYADLSGLRVLDAPCGNGGLAELLAEAGAIVDGWDLAPPASTEQDVTYKTVDFDHVPLIEPGVYELILSIEGVEHL